MSHPCLNLTARDFDAYLAEKATSNAYSRPRLEVKQRALAWGRGVAERLAELGIAADMHGSDEHPSLRNKKRVDCQWVFFWRDQDARAELDRLLEQGRSISAAIDDPSPYTRHAFLALRIDAEAVEVCFAVHPDAKVDVDNLRARLATADEKPGEATATLAAEFTAALRALPEEFQIGLRREDRAACSAATPETIVSMLERAAAGQTPLWIGWTVPRETAIAHSELLDEQLEDAIVALAPIYRLVAWSRENDHIALDTRIEGLEQAKARTHAEATAQNERWRAEQAALRERSQKQALSRVEEEAPRRPAAGLRAPPEKARRPSLDTLFKPQRGAGGGKPDGQAGKHDAHTGKPDARAERHDAHGSKQGAHGRRPDAQSGGGGGGGGGGGDSGGARQSARGAGGEGREGARASGQAGQADKPAAEPRDSQGSGGAPAGPLVIEKGSRVCVLTGAFAGKVGTVSELDGRGGARVLLGLLSTRLDLDALEAAPEGRDRPALQSSQRRAASPAAPPQPAQPPRKTR
jgi:uncharacterized membrane protein YgcG